MKKEITVPAISAAEINSLHAQIKGEKEALWECLKAQGAATIEKCFAIGDALLVQKAYLKDTVGHGNWLTWVATNLTFGDDQSRNYMKFGKVPKTERVRFFEATSLRQGLALMEVGETGEADKNGNGESGSTVGQEADSDSHENAQNPFVEAEPTFVSKLKDSFLSKTRFKKIGDWKPKEKDDLFFLYENIHCLVAELKLAGYAPPKQTEGKIIN